MRRLLRITLVAALVVLGAAEQAIPAQSAAEQAHRRGADALRARDYAAAVSALEQAVELDGRSVDAWFKLGLARSALQNGDGAAAAYHRVIELQPDHAKALNNLANVHFRQGRYDEAAEWYRRALDVRPDYLLALYHYGWVLRHFNRPAEAETMFDRCLRLEPRSDRERATRLDCLFYLGTLRFRAGNHAEAASVMESFLGMRPGHAEARYYLGMAYRHLGRIDEAREQLEIHRRLLRAARREEPIERQDDP